MMLVSSATKIIQSVRVVNGFAGGTGAYGKLDFGTFGACAVAAFLGLPMIYTRDDEIWMCA